MKHLHVSELHASALARVVDVACAAPRSSRGEPEWNAEPELIVPRRGVFALHRRDGVTVADAANAVLLGPGEDYRVSHPGGHGDACTVLAFAPDPHRRVGPAHARALARARSSRATCEPRRESLERAPAPAASG